MPPDNKPLVAFAFCCLLGGLVLLDISVPAGVLLIAIFAAIIGHSLGQRLK